MKADRKAVIEPRTRGRTGFTLAETLVVTVLALLVIGAVARALSIQGPGFQQQNSVARSMGNARLAVQLLANELREIAATDGDLLAVTETAVTVRSMRKLGFVCDAMDAEPYTIAVWVLSEEFSAGMYKDSVLVFLNHDTEIASDDEWVAAQLGAEEAATSGACGSWTRHRLSGSATGEYTVQRLKIGADLTGVAPGSPVRSFEYITYALQNVGGVWSLTRQNGPGGRVVTLVEDLAPADAAGLAFAYVDTAGYDLTLTQASADPGAVGRVSIVVTAREAAARLATNADGYHEDRLSAAVFLRNNHITQVDPQEHGTTAGWGDGGDDGGTTVDGGTPVDGGSTDGEGTADGGTIVDDGTTDDGGTGGGDTGGGDTGSAVDLAGEAETTAGTIETDAVMAQKWANEALAAVARPGKSGYRDAENALQEAEAYLAAARTGLQETEQLIIDAKSALYGLSGSALDEGIAAVEAAKSAYEAAAAAIDVAEDWVAKARDAIGG